MIPSLGTAVVTIAAAVLLLQVLGLHSDPRLSLLRLLQR